MSIDGGSARERERRALLAWVANLGAVTAEALAVRERRSVVAARSRMAAAQRHGLLHRHELLHGQPALYTLTAAGRRECGAADMRSRRVGPGNAAHAIACAHAAALLEAAFAAQRIVGEPGMRREERELGRPPAAACLGCAADGTLLLHRPDLLLRPGAAGARRRPVALEVELTAKAPQRLARILLAWSRCEDVEGVVYLVGAGLLPRLSRAHARAQAGARVAVLPLAALAAQPLDAARRSREPSRSRPTLGDRGWRNPPMEAPCPTAPSTASS